MQFYNVKFTFEIPVMVKEGNDAEIDAYYEARKEFPQFNINEATPKIDKIDEETFKSMREAIAKLHKFK